VSDRLAQLETRVEELSRALQRVEHRLAALDGGDAVAPVAVEAEAAVGLSAAAAPAMEFRTEATPEAEPQLEGPEVDLIRVVFLLGRTLMVLGGAYLLRAFTDAGALPRGVGIALGLAFALLWVAMAWRAGPRRPRSAGFHAAAAVLVAFPLVWEAAVRFQVLPVAAAVGLLGGVVALYLGVSWWRELPSLAWLTVLAGVITVWVFLLTAKAWTPGGLLLVAIGAVALLLAQLRGGWGLAWMAGALADGTMALLAVGVLSSALEVPAASAAFLLLTLAGVFLAAPVAGFLLQRRAPTAFELTQTGVVLTVGLWGGARVVATLPGSGSQWLGAAAVALSVAAYAMAMLHRQGGGEAWRRRGFFHLAGAGLVLALVGSAQLLPAEGLAILWSVVAVFAGFAARRLDDWTLYLHGAVALLVAAGKSGLLVAGAYALAVPATAAWPIWPGLAIVVLLAAAAATWLFAGSRSGSVLVVVPLAVLAWGGGGLVVRVLAAVLAGAPGAAADAGVLAMLRSGVLAVAAVLLAALGRGRLAAAAWLAYAVLVAAGLKLILEDFPQGRPATLFLALALYGGALIATARLARRRE